MSKESRVESRSGRSLTALSCQSDQPSSPSPVGVDAHMPPLPKLQASVVRGALEFQRPPSVAHSPLAVTEIFCSVAVAHRRHGSPYSACPSSISSVPRRRHFCAIALRLAAPSICGCRRCAEPIVLGPARTERSGKSFFSEILPWPW